MDGPELETSGSQNHLMLGSIEEWFYGSLGGMELVRDGLSFEEIRIHPQPGKRRGLGKCLDYASIWKNQCKVEKGK